MKTILITHGLRDLLQQEPSFLDRSDVRIFVAATTDEALQVLRSEQVDLVATALHGPGLAGEELCSRMRGEARNRTAALLMTCENSAGAIRASSQCEPSAVLLEPVPPVLLAAKARELLFIAARDSLRVTLDTVVDGRSNGRPFACRSRNISVSGMLIETERLLAADELLACRFYLPVAQSVEATGRIVRIIERSHANAAYQYGLMFTEVAGEGRRLIAEYVEGRSEAER